MMKKSMLFLLVGVLLLGGATGCADIRKVTMRGVQRMEPAELKSHLDDPAFTVIDVRIADDWNGSSRKIAGAHRELPDNVSTWQPKYSKDQTIVLYCA
jgi:predicted sulfurtransferase